MTKIAPVSYVRAHLPEMVASLGKKKRNRVVITRNGAPSAVLVSPEELETLEILADKKLMLSLLKAEADERAQRLVEQEIFLKDVSRLRSRSELLITKAAKSVRCAANNLNRSSSHKIL